MFDYEYRFKNLSRLYRLEGSDYDLTTYRMPSLYKKAVNKLFASNTIGYSWLGGNEEVKDVILQYETSLCGQFPQNNIPTVFVGSGASPLISLTLEAVIQFNKNRNKNEVILFFPDYPLYHSVVSTMGAIPKPLFSKRENDFLVTIKEVESAITKNTIAILFANPNNPTCKTYSLSWIKDLIALADKNNIFIISDEIYSHMLYDCNSFANIAAQKGNYNNVVKIFGLSKDRPGTTGLRTGYTICDNRLYNYLHDIQMVRNFSNNAVSDFILQIDIALRLFRRTKIKPAILEEFSDADINEYYHTIDENQKLQFENNKAVIKYLQANHHVSDIIIPDGGNLVFFRYYKNMSAEDLFHEFINKDLAIYPTDSFNMNPRQGSWIRICVTRNIKYLRRAIELI